MTEFSGSVSWDIFVIPKDGTITIPFSDGAGVSKDSFFDWNLFGGTEASGVARSGLPIRVISGGFEGFRFQYGWGISFKSESGNTSKD